MSQSFLPPSNQQKLLSIHPIQWTSLFMAFILTLIALIAPIVAFCVTRVPFSLIFLGAATLPGYMLFRIIKSLWPLNDKDYVIEKIVAQVAAHRISSPENEHQPSNQ